MTIEELYADIRKQMPGISRQRIRAQIRQAKRDGAITIVDGVIQLTPEAETFLAQQAYKKVEP